MAANELAPRFAPSPAAKKAKRDYRVALLSRKVLRVCSWLQHADRPAVRAWSELELLSQAAYAKLADGGLLNVEGEPKALVDTYQRLRRTQLAYSQQLGMTLKSRTEISSGSHSIPVEVAAGRIEKIRKRRDEIEDAENAEQS